MSGLKLTTGTVIGLGMTVVGLAAIAASLAIPPSSTSVWGARVFPLLGSCGLSIVGGIELWKNLRGTAVPIEQPAPVEGAPENPMRLILALLVLSIGYVWFMGKVGYLLSTGVASVLCLMLFGVRNPIGLAVAAVLCPLIYHFIFFVFLGVYPPYGEWFDLLDIIQGN